VVFTESAIAGQSAGLAMGLILLGSGNGEALEEMLKYKSTR
jgi:26S proteasome regulatory subunit N2